ncbi:hypothetical protein [Variovorax boronicumulans]|uniref:hypothetical protein n=1 Tax=Variovorax boronicumulans TaxID=436515 RepID=UPI0033920EEE
MRAARRLEHAGQDDLFGEAPTSVIEGLRYEREFLSTEEAPLPEALHLRGPARWAWQHAIAPTEALRYSITLRTRSRRRPRQHTSASRFLRAEENSN